MDKQKFIELTGEDPEDMFGPDWENELMGYGLNEEDEDEGGTDPEDEEDDDEEELEEDTYESDCE